MVKFILGLLLWVGIRFNEYEGFRYWLRMNTNYRVVHNNISNGILTVTIISNDGFLETYRFKE